MPVFTTEGVSGRAMQIARLNKSSAFSPSSSPSSPSVVSIFVLRALSLVSPADSVLCAARIQNANMKMSFRFRRCFRSTVYYSHSLVRSSDGATPADTQSVSQSVSQSDGRRDGSAVDFVTLRKYRRTRRRASRLIRQLQDDGGAGARRGGTMMPK